VVETELVNEIDRNLSRVVEEFFFVEDSQQLHLTW